MASWAAAGAVSGDQRETCFRPMAIPNASASAPIVSTCALRRWVIYVFPFSSTSFHKYSLVFCAGPALPHDRGSEWARGFVAQAFLPGIPARVVLVPKLAKTTQARMPVPQRCADRDER